MALWYPGQHRRYNGRYNGSLSRKMEPIPFKVGLSSDWGLQFDPMKSESLVIADQLCCGEYVLKLCTHRLSHQRSRGHLTSPIYRGLRWIRWLGWSHNKASVGEPVDGNYFYLVTSKITKECRLKKMKKSLKPASTRVDARLVSEQL